MDNTNTRSDQPTDDGTLATPNRELLVYRRPIDEPKLWTAERAAPSLVTPREQDEAELPEEVLAHLANIR